ncbi:MAG: hypothetical protein AB7V46_22210, partial [Thermomicrobiales bacterium]
MALLFDELDALAQAAVNLVFGEPIRLVPRRGSQYSARQADPDRPARNVVGVYSVSPRTDHLAGQRNGAELSGTTKLAGVLGEIWLSTDVVAGLGYPIRRGDAVQLLEKPGTPIF